MANILMKIRCVSEYFLLEKQNLISCLRRGELPMVKIGTDYITTESAVEKWIQENIGNDLLHQVFPCLLKSERESATICNKAEYK